MNHLLYEAQSILDRAADTLEEAEAILKMEMILAAANRTYYSIFYCISALLITEDIVSKSHKGALVKFSQLFIKTDKLPQKLVIWARKAEELRQTADYDFSSTVDENQVKEALSNAREFYNLTKAYIGRLIADSP